MDKILREQGRDLLSLIELIEYQILSHGDADYIRSLKELAVNKLLTNGKKELNKCNFSGCCSEHRNHVRLTINKIMSYRKEL